MNINGAIAFATGGSGGLGSVIATALAQAGYHIAAGYRDGRERAEETTQALVVVQRRGGDGHAFS